MSGLVLGYSWACFLELDNNCRELHNFLKTGAADGAATSAFLGRNVRQQRAAAASGATVGAIRGSIFGGVAYFSGVTLVTWGLRALTAVGVGFADVIGAIGEVVFPPVLIPAPNLCLMVPGSCQNRLV